MFKALLSLALLLPSSSFATGYLVHSMGGARTMITGVTSTLQPQPDGTDKLFVNLLTGVDGKHACTFPFSALEAVGYKDVAALTHLLANERILTIVHCYTQDRRPGTTSSVMIDTKLAF